MAPDSTRPLLLPVNRKLRHLRGVSLRSLSFAHPDNRARDDVAVKSPPGKQSAEPAGAALLYDASSVAALRPKARRRSTVIASETPLMRQRRLQETIESRVADAFFSLHVERQEDPFYISELAESATNFNFRFFDLADLGSTVTRSPVVTIKVWTRQRGSWSLLLEQEVDLRTLSFVGSLQELHFPPNCLVFHFIDGTYSLDLSSPVPERKNGPGPSLPTSSYNALMRLATLDESIRDALATRQKLADQINAIVAEQKPNMVPEAEGRVALASRYVQQQRRAVRSTQKRRDDLRASIDARRAAMERGRALQQNAADEVAQAESGLAESRNALATAKDTIHGQRRRICSDLMDVFPIVLVPDAPQLSFQICGLPLPNTTYEQAALSTPGTEDLLSAALGLVAQLTYALQFYLAVPLNYELRPFGSRSSIRDDISILPDHQREFPLYMARRGSGSAQYRFDYGWFLLNKDIEALCVSQGLKVVDIRHTLPNLKYLLYVASAGTDEFPARKRGGVRGLWASRILSRGMSNDDSALSGSASGSRRGSAESETLTKQREELRRAVRENGAQTTIGKDGQHPAAALAASPKPSSPLGLPFDEGEMKLTLRTKGLRENVVK